MNTDVLKTQEITVDNSLFSDDVWDLSPFIPQKTVSPSRKKLNFGRIAFPDLRHTVKLYMLHKFNQVKPQSLIGIMNSLLPYFIRYCELNAIHSFSAVTGEILLNFAFWLKTDALVSKRTGYMASFVVEDIIRIGQIKGWNVPADFVLAGVTAAEIWGSGKDENGKKFQPIPDAVFDRIIDCALNRERNILTKAGIIIQSQTGLRIGEVLSIQSGCLHQPKDSPAYFEVCLSKTVKGEPIIHKVFANELVIAAINELEQHTAPLRKESGLSDLFLHRNQGVNVAKTMNWSKNRLRTFIRRHDIRGTDGQLYPLKSHQFRATFVRQLILKHIPIAYVMKQFSHVSIEMTCHYLSLQEKEIKDIYSHLILSPDAKIVGINTEEIKSRTNALFRGKTKSDVKTVISELSESLSFNPLPGGICLYDYRRGNCTNGDGCFFYNSPNYITEVSFLPVLQKELDLMEKEMQRTKQLGFERQWQIQYSRYQYLKPLVAQLEAMKNA
jgi:integrase